MDDFPDLDLSSIAAWNASVPNDPNPVAAPILTPQGQYQPAYLSLPNAAVRTPDHADQSSVHTPDTKQSVKRKRKDPDAKVGDGKHDCLICGRPNDSEANLKVHVREKHSQDRPWFCTICFPRGDGTAYARHFSAKRHIILSHGHEGQEADRLVGEHKLLADKSLAVLLREALAAINDTAPDANSQHHVQMPSMPQPEEKRRRLATPAIASSPAQSFVLGPPAVPSMLGQLGLPASPVAPSFGSFGLPAAPMPPSLGGFDLPAQPFMEGSAVMPAVPQVSEQPATLHKCPDCTIYFASREMVLLHGHNLPHLKPNSIDCDCSICTIIFGGDLAFEPAMTDPQFDGPDWQFYPCIDETDEVAEQHRELMKGLLLSP